MSQNTVQTYLNLVTSEHQGKPDFAAVITAAVAPLVQVQFLLNAMIPLFDLDLSPVGDQLDILGEWVGASRQISSPFANVFFTWDGVQADGWDFGVWQETGAPSALVTLPDDVYLTYILAKIATNAWDGTTTGIYTIFENVLPQYNLMIQDNQNMSFVVVIQGTVPDSLTAALFVGGYLVPRPEGIQITDYVLPVDTNPIFAWDSESPGLGGWDQASWGNWVAPT